MFHKSWKMFGLFYVYRFVVILLQQVTYTCLSGSIQVCIAVLFGSFYIDLFYPSLEILFYNFAGALSVVQYTCIVLHNCKTKIKTDKKN